MYFLSMTDKSSWDNEGGDAIWNTNISLLKQQGTLSQALHTGKHVSGNFASAEIGSFSFGRNRQN